jgi:hypothetical protein
MVPTFLGLLRQYLLEMQSVQEGRRYRVWRLSPHGGMRTERITGRWTRARYIYCSTTLVAVVADVVADVVVAADVVS